MDFDANPDQNTEPFHAGKKRHFLTMKGTRVCPPERANKPCRSKLTINVPLFKKLRDIIFLGGGESLYEPFRGTI